MPHAHKPYAPSCDENREPILAVIRPLFAQATRLLEIGSGTGQHALYFAAAMSHLQWQTSDTAAQLPGIRAWLAEGDPRQLPAPLLLDVTGTWPTNTWDAVFSANTAHIMPWKAVLAMFAGVAQILEPGGHFALYGPFNAGGDYTSEGNRQFDAWLKAQDPRMGLRDEDILVDHAATLGLTLIARHAMPVNNRTLVWQRAARDVALIRSSAGHADPLN